MQRGRRIQPLCRFIGGGLRCFVRMTNQMLREDQTTLICEWKLLPNMWKAGANAKQDFVIGSRDSTLPARCLNELAGSDAFAK